MRVVRNLRKLAQASAVILAIGEAHAQAPVAEGTGGRCVPVAERGSRELGCFIIAREGIDPLPGNQVYWHLDLFPTLVAAQAEAGPRSVAVKAFGKHWLLTIEDGGWRPKGGERAALIGPLPIEPASALTAQYMEASFQPGMKSGIAQRSGPEVWYTLSGESCLETPAGTMVGRVGEEPVIAPAGVPMQVTATGVEMRQAIVLVLHDATKPAATPVSDWTPQGLC
jgi:hypothetical protein